MVLHYLKAGYAKLKQGLAKTGSLLGNKLRSLFSQKLSEETLEKLEQTLYEADVGVKAAQELTGFIEKAYQQNPSLNGEQLLGLMRDHLIETLQRQSPSLHEIPKEEGPLVILVVGVNGNGKTTSVAKLAHYYQNLGKKVLVGAADTFRAAAIDQLEKWAVKLHADIVKGNPKSDPASVAFDAVSAAKARGCDVVIIDTAGRLHTKTDLMQELEKIRRSCKKICPNSPHETLLVLDATTGQNAIDQAKTFHRYTPISGLILTKLDGTAKGGIVIAIQGQIGIPVKLIGVGEGVGDLEAFDAKSFIEALLR